MTEETETRQEPIAGSVVDTEWVSDGAMIATVEKDGETWTETYEFVEAEKVE